MEPASEAATRAGRRRRSLSRVPAPPRDRSGLPVRAVLLACRLDTLEDPGEHRRVVSVAKPGGFGVGKPLTRPLRQAQLDTRLLGRLENQIRVLAREVEGEPRRILAAFDRRTPSLRLVGERGLAEHLERGLPR